MFSEGDFVRYAMERRTQRASLKEGEATHYPSLFLGAAYCVEEAEENSSIVSNRKRDYNKLPEGLAERLCSAFDPTDWDASLRVENIFLRPWIPSCYDQVRVRVGTGWKYGAVIRSVVDGVHVHYFHKDEYREGRWSSDNIRQYWHTDIPVDYTAHSLSSKGKIEVIVLKDPKGILGDAWGALPEYDEKSSVTVEFDGAADAWSKCQPAIGRRALDVQTDPPAGKIGFFYQHCGHAWPRGIWCTDPVPPLEKWKDYLTWPWHNDQYLEVEVDMAVRVFLKERFSEKQAKKCPECGELSVFAKDDDACSNPACPKFDEGNSRAAERAYWFACSSERRLPEERECIVLRDTHLAVCYAKNVVKGRWKPVEDDMFYRHPDRHKVYVEANEYAKDVVKGRWPEFEEAILDRAVADPGWMAYIYARDILKGPWPEAEDVIAEDGMASDGYASAVLNAPWPKGEPAIAKYWGAAEYAIRIRKTRFPEAEEELRRHPHHWEMYCKHFGLDA
jgi:hypothetical protein